MPSEVIPVIHWPKMVPAEEELSFPDGENIWNWDCMDEEEFRLPIIIETFPSINPSPVYYQKYFKRF